MNSLKNCPSTMKKREFYVAISYKKSREGPIWSLTHIMRYRVTAGATF